MRYNLYTSVVALLFVLIVSLPARATTPSILDSGIAGVGIGTTLHSGDGLDVYGNASVGSYGGATAAPSNGMIVSGSVGMGTNSPQAELHINGGGIILGNTVTCATANTGEIIWTGSALQYCNGSSWLTVSSTNVGYFVMSKSTFNGCMAQTISTITNSGTTATLTTAAAHDLSTGQTVVIAGTTPAAYSGTFSITKTGATTFTYTMLSNPGGSATVVGTYCVSASLTDADKICLNEITANTNWLGYTAANGNSQLVSAKVHALLCDGNTCNILRPNTPYYFADANNVAHGSVDMTTDSNGYVPGNSTAWSGATYFGATYTYWTNYRIGTTTYLDYNGNTTNNCTNITTSLNSVSGEYGSSAATTTGRWASSTATCDTLEHLVCFVNP